MRRSRSTQAASYRSPQEENEDMLKEDHDVKWVMVHSAHQTVLQQYAGNVDMGQLSAYISTKKRTGREAQQLWTQATRRGGSFTIMLVGHSRCACTTEVTEEETAKQLLLRMKLRGKALWYGHFQLHDDLKLSDLPALAYNVTEVFPTASVLRPWHVVMHSHYIHLAESSLPLDDVAGWPVSQLASRGCCGS